MCVYVFCVCLLAFVLTQHGHAHIKYSEEKYGIDTYIFIKILKNINYIFVFKLPNFSIKSILVLFGFDFKFYEWNRLNSRNGYLLYQDNLGMYFVLLVPRN